MLGIAAAAVEGQDHWHRLGAVVRLRDVDEVAAGPLVHFEGPGVVAGLQGSAFAVSMVSNESSSVRRWSSILIPDNLSLLLKVGQVIRQGFKFCRDTTDASPIQSSEEERGPQDMYYLEHLQ